MQTHLICLNDLNRKTTRKMQNDALKPSLYFEIKVEENLWA